ncbi:MAG: VIT1/CCC1 transporter family protein [Christensenellales bacterium]|jgi:VIT1/CCC1 family predicted Fe2+/Mn2+ transporter
MSDKLSCLSQQARETILRMQQNEITEWASYHAIASQMKDDENKKILMQLGEEEKRHAHIWQTYTGVELKPQKFKVFWRKLLTRLLGYTFVIKLMENGEENAQETYAQLAREVPEAARIEAEENAHEQKLIDMLDEERLQYVGSMVLGLNDALVELTGTLAGLTLAIQNTRIIALSGLITGISATLSMASSEYLSARSEGKQDALRSCMYTGVAYLITVILLILPYLLFDADHYLYALFTMLAIVVLVILVFNYYISTAKGYSFKRRFGEMVTISLGVAVLSFVIGLVVKHALGVDI